MSGRLGQERKERAEALYTAARSCMAIARTVKMPRSGEPVMAIDVLIADPDLPYKSGEAAKIAERFPGIPLLSVAEAVRRAEIGAPMNEIIAPLNAHRKEFARGEYGLVQYMLSVYCGVTIPTLQSRS